MGVDFHAPRSVEEALRLVGDDALVLAGGTQLAPRLRDGRARARRLVWLGRVPGLDAVVATPDGGVVVGATATLGTLASSPLLVGGLACLAEAAAPVGNPRVRARATVGGGVVHADPRQDVPAALLALGARVRLRGPGGRREVPLAQLRHADGDLDLDAGELVTSFVLPSSEGAASTHLRFTPASRHDYPTVAASARVVVDGDGHVAHAVVGLAGAAATPLALDVTAALRDHGPADPAGRATALDAAARLAAAAAAPTDDRHGSPAYKREMAGVWSRRSLALALDRALGGTPGRAPDRALHPTRDDSHL